MLRMLGLLNKIYELITFGNNILSNMCQSIDTAFRNYGYKKRKGRVSKFSLNVYCILKFYGCI